MTRHVKGGDVVIVGAGPAGLLLSYVLHKAGIENVVLEQRSQSYVEARIRAGQLDYSSTQYLEKIGIGARLKKEGIPQKGFNLAFGGGFHRIDLEEATNGRYCTIYGQSELTKDLIKSHADNGASPVFEAEVLGVDNFEGNTSIVRYIKDGIETHVRAKFVIGCDGYFGKTRRVIEAVHGNGMDTSLPVSWLGILTETPPISKELTYIYDEKGFALCSMRSPTLSRIYLQCDADDALDNWDDDRFWSSLEARLGAERAGQFNKGKIVDRTMVKMRGYMARQVMHKNVILAGDAAHIVPPSAAKGLNLAIADIAHLSTVLIEYFETRNISDLNAYPERALVRAWRAQEFSHYMTNLLHAAPMPDEFDDSLKRTRLHKLVTSSKHLAQFADEYVGR